jgi:hypothetical protein
MCFYISSAIKPLLLIAVLYCGGAMAQPVTLKGKVNDTDKQGIPFAIVQIKGQQRGAYCDENGMFALNLNKDSSYTLMVQCLGYVSKDIAIDKPVATDMLIELQPKEANLKEVVVKADLEKRQTGIIGKQGIRNFGQIFSKYVGGTWAIFLKSDSTKKGFLKDVHIYVTKLGDPNTKFRVHIYGIDTVKYLPLDDLADSNIIVHANKGNEWVVVDLSQMRIPVRKGLFVGVEWISVPGNDMSMKHKGDIDYIGMVLGLTKGYGHNMLMYVRNVKTGEWEWLNNPLYSGLNPAIYASYYYK